MSENVSRYKIQDTLKVSKIRILRYASKIISSTAYITEVLILRLLYQVQKP